MFQSLFNPDSTFFRFTGRVLDAVVLSVLFLLCCLPVVTIGPAASALYYSCVKYIRRGESGAYRGFFHAFRDNLRAGIPAWPWMRAFSFSPWPLRQRETYGPWCGWCTVCCCFCPFPILP